MPTYKVGVVLSATAGKYRAGLKAATTTTKQTQTALSRASGAAKTFGASTDQSSRRARRALDTASRSVRPLQDALRRTADHARRMGADTESAARRAGRGVDTLAGRYRNLSGSIRTAGDAARRTGMGGGGGGGAGTPLWQQAAGAVGTLGTGAILVQSIGRVNQFEQQLADVGGAAGLTAEEREAARMGINAAATDESVRLSQSRILTELHQAHSLTGKFRKFSDDGGRALGVLARASGAAAGDIGRLSGSISTVTDDWVEGSALALSVGDEGSVPLEQMGRYMGAIVAPKAAHGLKALEEFHDAVAAYQIAGIPAGGEGGRALSMYEAFANNVLSRPDPALAQRIQLYREDGTTPRPFMELGPEIVEAFNPNELAKVVPDQMARLFLNAFRSSKEKQQALLAVCPADLEARAAGAANTRIAKRAGFAASVDAMMQDVAPLFNPLYDLVSDLPIGTLAAAAGAGLLARADWRARLGTTLTRTAGRGLGLFRRRPAPTPQAGAGTFRMMAGATTTAGPGVAATTAGRTAPGRLARAGGALRAASGRAADLAGRIPGAGRGLLQRTGGVLRGAGRKVPYLGVALGGLDVTSALARGDAAGAARASGGLAGSLAGAAAGAAIGSMVPLIGTAIGGLVGGLAGYSGGDWLASRMLGATGGEEPGAAEGLPDAALEAAGQLDTLAAHADAAGRALEALRPAPLDRLRPTIHQDHRVGRIEIGPIVIQSPTDDPRALGEQVADEVRRILDDDQRRLTDTLVADPSPEGAL